MVQRISFNENPPEPHWPGQVEERIWVNRSSRNCNRGVRFGVPSPAERPGNIGTALSLRLDVSVPLHRPETVTDPEAEAEPFAVALQQIFLVGLCLSDPRRRIRSLRVQSDRPAVIPHSRNPSNRRRRRRRGSRYDGPS